MHSSSTCSFSQFASAFLHEYWSTIKAETFPRPPKEPVRESLEELLSVISFTTKKSGGSNQLGHKHILNMTNEWGDSWLFEFGIRAEVWTILAAHSGTNSKKSQQDLLGSLYEAEFRPFLEHVTAQANATIKSGHS